MLQVWNCTTDHPVYLEPGQAKCTILRQLVVDLTGNAPYMIEIRETIPRKNRLYGIRLSGLGQQMYVHDLIVYVPISIKLWRIGRPTPRDVPPRVRVFVEW